MFLRVMRVLATALVAWIVLLGGCMPPENEQTGELPVMVAAAFMDLDRVEVFSPSGEYVTTLDVGVDFSEVLPVGYYLMDFISGNDQHSFFSDGRISFAPMMQGGLPVDGPHLIDGEDAPMWGVEVHPSLEANANIIKRQREMDESLLPWKRYFRSWGGALNEEWEPNYDQLDGGFRSWSTAASGAYASDRLRVTWEASFAMTGKFTTSSSDVTTCNNATSCWTRSGSTPSGSYYAVWDHDSNNVGYIDYDTSAWSTANSAYGSSGSCAAAWTPCGLTVGVSNARNYTCQSASGTCTSGSSASATKPHGGQCKMFQNLLLYRSGEYNNGSWRTLPSDATITANPATYPAESVGTMNVGDALRNPTQIHSTIVVAIDAATSTALVVDSNWVGTVGTTYYEYIGAHVMGFSGSGVSDLDNYRKMDCVYSGGC